jgi:hypothetical protein
MPSILLTRVILCHLPDLAVVAAANGSGSDHPRAVDHGRSLVQEVVFQLEATDKLEDNFEASTTQDDCYCNCGFFSGGLVRYLCGSPAFTGIGVIGDVPSDNGDFFVTGYAGSGGFNYLTSTSALPFCPSTVTFDYKVFFQAYHLFREVSLRLEVIDTSDNIIFEREVDIPTNLNTGFQDGEGALEITLKGIGFNFCAENLRLRFAWNVPTAGNSGDGEFVLANVVVTPDQEAVRKLSARFNPNYRCSNRSIASISSHLSPCLFP